MTQIAAYFGEMIRVSAPTTAGEDLSGAQFTAVDFDTSGNIVAATAGGTTIGTLINKPKANSGEAAQVCAFGTTKVVLGGTVAAGAQLAVGTGGKYVTAASTNVVCGRAFFGGAANDVVTALIYGQTAVHA
jgi:hypothetical protein